MRASLRIGLVVILVGLSVRAWGAEPSPSAITVFSFDNVTIPFTHNLNLTMVPATRYPGNPVLSHGPEGSPDAWRAQFYGSIVRVDGKFRMWYCAEGDPDPERLGWVDRDWVRPREGERFSSFRPAYAESVDGIHWTKPKLGLVEYKGNKDNNLLQFSPQPHFEITAPTASFVLYDPSDPNPARRYKMPLYGRFFHADDVERKHSSSTIYPYFSADGLHWQLATPPPKNGVTYDEKEAPLEGDSWFELGGVYKFGGLYYIAGQGGAWMPDGKPAGRVMLTHWSSDFVHWSEDRALSFVRYGYRSRAETLNEAHEPAAVWNRNNVLVGTFGLWQGSEKQADLRMPLGFVISNDGIHFREPQPDFEFLSPGADGEWDARGLLNDQAFINVGDQTYVYYGTWNLAFPGDAKASVGLSTLRRDGFGYLSVRGNGDATFTTIPLMFPQAAKGIKLNVSGLGREAHLRVELLDRLGKGVAGYSGAKGAVADHEGLAEPVRWSSGQLPAGPGPYRLRIHFEGTDKNGIRFYAAYVE